MSYTPPDLAALGSYWHSMGGVNLGVVGNQKHCKGYHLGKDRIYGDCACKDQRTGLCIPGEGANDYSVHDFPVRDKAALTNAASAIDLGKLNGTLANLQAFSRWLVAQCVAGAPGTNDIREVIFSPDGSTVKRWSVAKRSAAVAYPTPYSSAVASHQTHTHISYFRDSRSRDKTALFKRYFVAPDTATEEPDVPVLSSYIPGQIATVKAGMNVRSAAKLTATVLRVTSAAETWVVAGYVKGDLDGDCGTDQWLVRWASGRWEYTSACNLASGPAPAPDPTPYSSDDLAAAKRAGGKEVADAAALAASKQ